MPRNAWLTPPPPTEPPASRTLTVSDDWRFWVLVNGALLLLTKAENWEQSENGMTPEEAAEYFWAVFQDYVSS
jgi:hypothetical protein